MQHFEDYADERLLNGCIYCGSAAQLLTKDHVPSRALLDVPFPENLPVVAACHECNNGFSRDEEYLACLLEATISGTTDPSAFERTRVAAMLRHSAGLQERLAAAKHEVDGRVAFEIEEPRVRNVLVKLARGHAAYELSAPLRHEPSTVEWLPLELMTRESRDSFDAAHVPVFYPEVGSRALQRMVVAQFSLRTATGSSAEMNTIVNDWIEVQPDRYRYLAIDDVENIVVKIIVREYLACQVTWRTEGARFEF